MAEFAFACPACGTSLERAGDNRQRCPEEGTLYPQVDGIWRMLAPDRLAAYAQFVAEYETVRRREGRGSREPAYYRNLPCVGPQDPWQQDWRLRSRSFQTLQDKVVASMEVQVGRPLSILDLGAGNGWLSHRLAQRGHQVLAVDLLTNPWDGLGAHVHYLHPFTPVQAEYQRLPLAAGQVDLAIFNASFHYAADYRSVLQETLRVLGSGGALTIVDTPIYRQRRSGQQMVRERETDFTRRFGFPSNALASRSFLTFREIDELGAQLGLGWRRIRPRYGWRRWVAPWLATLRGRREPARFVLLMATKGKG